MSLCLASVTRFNSVRQVILAGTVCVFLAFIDELDPGSVSTYFTEQQPSWANKQLKYTVKASKRLGMKLYWRDEFFFRERRRDK